MKKCNNSQSSSGHFFERDYASASVTCVSCGKKAVFKHCSCRELFVIAVEDDQTKCPKCRKVDKELSEKKK